MEADLKDLKDREDQGIPGPRIKNQQAVNLVKGEPTPAPDQNRSPRNKGTNTA